MPSWDENELMRTIEALQLQRDRARAALREAIAVFEGHPVRPAREALEDWKRVLKFAGHQSDERTETK